MVALQYAKLAGHRSVGTPDENGTTLYPRQLDTLSLVRDCAIIIRSGAKNELGNEKYYIILPLNKGKLALTPYKSLKNYGSHRPILSNWKAKNKSRKISVKNSVYGNDVVKR